MAGSMRTFVTDRQTDGAGFIRTRASPNKTNDGNGQTDRSGFFRTQVSLNTGFTMV